MVTYELYEVNFMKTRTLRLNKEFKRAYYQGKFKAHPLMVTYMVKNRERCARIGITTSKKIGCAVKRNRARRIIKQAFFELRKDQLISNEGYDFVFVARDLTPLSTTEKVKAVMAKQINMIKKR